VVRNGKVEAIDLGVAMPSVIGSQMGRSGISLPGPDSQIAAGSWNNPYALPHYRMQAFRVPELAPVSSWRSVGASANGFFFDCFLDELIREAGADPMEERIRLMEHDVSRKVLEAVADMSSWGGELGPNKGRGVAFVESFGVPTAEVIEVTNTKDGIRVDKVWLAADVGKVIDPVNFENLGQGGVVFGLGHAMNCEITYSDGMAEQSNFGDHEAMRISQCPEIFVKGLENGSKVRGFGEPPVPPAAPALANAIFAATGQRIREMPFNKHIDFV
jgi:isoquinoline 1-oxidoreductase beta subunit